MVFIAGEMCTCSHEVVVSGHIIQGGLRIQVNYIMKTIGAKKFRSLTGGGRRIWESQMTGFTVSINTKIGSNGPELI